MIPPQLNPNSSSDSSFFFLVVFLDFADFFTLVRIYCFVSSTGVGWFFGLGDCCFYFSSKFSNLFSSLVDVYPPVFFSLKIYS